MADGRYTHVNLTALCKMIKLQFYWTHGSVAVNDSKHNPSRNEYRMRYRFGTGPTVMETGTWPPLWYKNGSWANAQKACAEYRWPLTQPYAKMATNECWKTGYVLCKSACKWGQFLHYFEIVNSIISCFRWS